MNFWIHVGIIIICAFSAGSCSIQKTNNERAQNSEVYKDAAVTAFFKRTDGLVAGDGGFSVSLPDDRVLWLFGDSFIDHYDPETHTTPCLFQVRNTGMIQPADDWNPEHTSTIASPSGQRDLFQRPDHPDELFFWPGDGIVIEGNLYVFLHQLRNTGSGALGFEAAGGEMWARMPLHDLKEISYLPLPDLAGISFGEGFVPAGEEDYVYAYGSKLDFIHGDVFVARFRKSDPLKWTFWNGERWQSSASKAVKVATGASNNVHVSKINDYYLLLSAEFSVGCDQGKEIFASVSRSPMGPFSEPRSIYTLEDTLKGHYPFFYLPVAHPEYINDRGELLITYSINGYEDCIPVCKEGRRNPDHYRLRAIRWPTEQLSVLAEEREQ